MNRRDWMKLAGASVAGVALGLLGVAACSLPQLNASACLRACNDETRACVERTQGCVYDAQACLDQCGHDPDCAHECSEILTQCINDGLGCVDGPLACAADCIEDVEQQL